MCCACMHHQQQQLIIEPHWSQLDSPVTACMHAYATLCLLHACAVLSLCVIVRSIYSPRAKARQQVIHHDTLPMSILCAIGGNVCMCARTARVHVLRSDGHGTFEVSSWCFGGTCGASCLHTNSQLWCGDARLYILWRRARSVSSLVCACG